MAYGSIPLDKRLKDNIRNYKLSSLIDMEAILELIKAVSKTTGVEVLVTERHGEKVIATGKWAGINIDVDENPGVKVRVLDRTIAHIYADYDEQERHSEAIKDAELTDEEFNNPEFRAACRKFREIQESNKSIKLLNAAKAMVDKFIDYFNQADPLERDEQTGKPIFKVKDIQAEMKNLIDVHETMVNLESQVKKQIQAQSTLRGGVIRDFDPGDF